LFAKEALSGNQILCSRGVPAHITGCQLPLFPLRTPASENLLLPRSSTPFTESLTVQKTHTPIQCHLIKRISPLSPSMRSNLRATIIPGEAKLLRSPFAGQAVTIVDVVSIPKYRPVSVPTAPLSTPLNSPTWRRRRTSRRWKDNWRNTAARHY